MRKLSHLLALLAAIMLLIGGAPTMAAAQPCDPCPPDCAMMQQLAEHASDPQKAPNPTGKADNPCQQMAVCQTVTATVAPSELVSFVALSAGSVTHELFDPLQAPSRPPDRSLRPPIHI